MAIHIIPLEDAVSGGALAALPPAVLEEFRHDFAPPAGRLLAAHDPARRTILGCAGFRRVDALTCEVRRMVVNWDEQRRGLGRRLMSALLAEAARAGYRRMLARVPQSVPALAAFYDRLGFARPATTGPRAGELCFELTLPAPAQQPHAAA